MERMSKQPLPLHASHVDKLSSAINRAHTLTHSFFLSILVYHRLSLLNLILTQNDDVFSTSKQPPPPLLPYLLLFLAELLLCLLWLSEQAFRWRPVKRTVFVDRLPEESKLPAVDVVICTADPKKEPTVDVMNTVVSAMALDYPAGKLHVYLSDDGGSAKTLRVVKEAWGFATWWLPFCRRYGVNCRCPMSYFDQEGNQSATPQSDFFRERLRLKEKYELFKERVETILRQDVGETDYESRDNHSPVVQEINENCADPSIINPDQVDTPLLVYVAREKRPSHPHQFKAGALNVLLRVSGLLSNSPVLLVLDCDMYCNDPTTAKQAMCFYLDEDISPSLAFVQFPQRFHNLNKDDLYDTGLRSCFRVLLQGVDGLNSRPWLCGTGFYINRNALYSGCMKGPDLVELRNTFGPSNEFIQTLTPDIKPKEISYGEISEELLLEAEFLATCIYEKETKWGEGVGFYYGMILEDVFTGYNLHCRGWKSTYLSPERDPFLGTTTTNLNDVLTQGSRWYASLVELALSRFCSLVYAPSRRQLSFLERICYAWLTLYPLMCISIWCLAIIPQLCLLHGIPLYPKVSSLLFPVLACIFFSSLLKHLYEVLTTRGTVMSWWNEQRMWILKMLTCYTYGSIDAVMQTFGLKEMSFIPTNKFIDEEQEKRYQQGIYDFQTSNQFLVPLGTAVIVNLVCFVGGLARLRIRGNWDEMAAQVILSGFCLVLSKPIIEGMIVRNDRGRFPTSATLMSVVVCLIVLMLGSFIVVH